MIRRFVRGSNSQQDESGMLQCETALKLLRMRIVDEERDRWT